MKTLFNKAVTENALKWPFFEGFGRVQADFMLPWFAANGITKVRGHNVIWPGMSNLPADVQAMLRANPVDRDAVRTRVNNHIAQVMAYTKGKLTEWDVLNEPYSNKDLQAALGDAEMAEWFKAARAADPSVKLYINDYNTNVPAKRDFLFALVQRLKAEGVPIDGVGHQVHINIDWPTVADTESMLTKFIPLNIDQQITEMDVSIYTGSGFPIWLATCRFTLGQNRYSRFASDEWIWNSRDLTCSLWNGARRRVWRRFRHCFTGYTVRIGMSRIDEGANRLRRPRLACWLISLCDGIYGTARVVAHCRAVCILHR